MEAGGDAEAVTSYVEVGEVVIELPDGILCCSETNATYLMLG